jgi:hypothetical protein
MNDTEKLERLKSLESMADDCIHEIAGLLPNVDVNIWSRLRDSIQDEIGRLEAKVEYDNYEMIQTGPWGFEWVKK